MAKNYRPVSFLSDKSLKTLFKISLLITLRNAVFFYLEQGFRTSYSKCLFGHTV